MKKLAWLMALVLCVSMIGLPSFAEEAEGLAKAGITVIEASGEQVELGVAGTPILEIDGLKFKDMNDNGTLDVYEDWRKPIDERVADLLKQMTLAEKAGLMLCSNTAMQFSGTYPVTENYLYRQDCPYTPDESEPNSRGYSAWYQINTYNIKCFLDNANGAPEEQVFVHNEVQKMCEDTRLAIPMVFTCDREYNAWGGYIDSPKTAFGFQDDIELSSKLWARYAQESRAVGVHVALQPYGNEIGSFNGEDPAHIAKMTFAEVSSLEQNGLNACTKHWIARGGDSSFGNARSVAQTVDNWLEGWKAAIAADTSWIMTNSAGLGFSNQGSLDYDRETMAYLRETLGFDGVIVTDWWALSVNEGTIDADGIDLGKLTVPERYARMIENGIDVFGSEYMFPGIERDGTYHSDNYPEAIVYAVENGILDVKYVDAAATRILKNKFELGLFENPYSDPVKAMALCCSESYIASHQPIYTFEEYANAPRDITTNEDIKAFRAADVVALEEQLQASSAVLVKNDENLLPLAAGTKVFLTTASADTTAHFTQYLGGTFTVTATMEEADVAIGLFSSVDDVAELFVDDAHDLGKKIVFALNNSDPTAYAIENADALLQLTFSRGADHGSAQPGFITTMEPWVFTDLLSGKAEPKGMINKELARDSVLNEIQWKDLAGDQGASNYVRMMLLAMMKTSENYTTPANWGDPLLCYGYGMRYGEQPAFAYDTLLLPLSVQEVTTESNGSTSTSTKSVTATKVGVPFNVYTLLWNFGGDGVKTVQVYDNGTLVAEKVMAVNGGDWRVVEIELTLDTVGDHVIQIGDMQSTLTIQE